jgi:hypothetical protein
MSAQLITQGWGAGLGIAITVATPPFPNVPALPGVPQLARSLLLPAAAPPTIGTQATSGALWQSTQSAPVWGIFDSDNNQVVNPDSVLDFGWRQEIHVSKFPIQAGQFANYNRVFVPFESSVVLTKGGALADRTAFLQEIDAIAAPNNINLYTIRTPEKSYQNVSVTRAELSRREAKAAYWFDVEVFFVQIAQVDAQYSSTSAATPNASVPSAIPSANQGQTQAQTPPQAVQTSALAAITPPVPTG